jgi:uncharacterized protein YbaP (TraB family)
MRRWFLIFGLLGCLSAQAQSPVWALKGAHNTVYLAGSVHFLKKGDSALPAAFDRAYASAQALVMEVDIDDLNSPETQALMLQKSLYPEGGSLRATIGETRYGHVEKEAGRLGLPMEGLNLFEPWAVALTLTQIEYAKLGFDSDDGVEQQLGRRAHVDGKPVTGLETLAEQIDILATMSAHDQTEFLDQTVLEMNEADAETRAILTAWRTGNTGRLATLMSEDFKGFPEIYRLLVSDRNSRWMPQIKRLLAADTNYLVVVGTLHLVGEGGLLQLAKSAGFEPRPLQ